MSRSLGYSGCGDLQWNRGQTHTLGHEHDGLGEEPRSLLGWRVQGCSLLGWGLFSISGANTEAPHQPTGPPAGPGQQLYPWAGSYAVWPSLPGTHCAPDELALAVAGAAEGLSVAQHPPLTGPDRERKRGVLWPGHSLGPHCPWPGSPPLGCGLCPR